MSSGDTMPSIDTTLGIISNNNQTSDILDNQRAVTESIKNSMERNAQGLSSTVANDADTIVYIVDRNNLSSAIERNGSMNMNTTERTSAANAIASERIGGQLATLVEKIIVKSCHDLKIIC
jgi:hypothetical protein